MKLYYLANIRLPTEKAHGVQIMEMGNAFAGIGLDFALVIPKRKVANKVDPFAYYEIENRFPIIRIFTLDFYGTRLEKVAEQLVYWLQLVTFCVATLQLPIKDDAVILTREKLVVLLHGFLSRRIILESHDSTKNNWLNRLVASRCEMVVGITRAIVKSWEKFPCPTLYLPSGVSPLFFSRLPLKQARKQLNLSLSQYVLVYAGNIYPWKGVDLLLQTVSKMPEMQLYVVGGEKETRFDELKKAYYQSKNIHFVGNRPHDQVVIWLKAANIVVIPNSGQYQKSRLDTSSLKLFEALASGRPTLVSDIPSHSEIVSRREVWFFRADNSIDLRNRLIEIRTTPAECVKPITRAAQRLASSYTWAKRAHKILDTIND